MNVGKAGWNPWKNRGQTGRLHFHRWDLSENAGQAPIFYAAFFGAWCRAKAAP